MNITAGSRAIDKIFKRRDRYEIPDWQRGEVWPRERKQKLIDSILRGWKLPKFYFLQLTEESYEVVDGQQRLSAIYEFFANELPLAKDTAKIFGGPFLKDLPAKHADAFDDFEIEFDLIEDEDTNEKDLKEFFQRLQQGLPLTSSEKLNSVHSKLRDYCRKLAEHPFLSDKVSATKKRYGHFDIISKVAAIEIEGLDVGLRYEEMKALFESQAHFSPASNVGKRVRAALDFLNKAFTEQEDPLLRNRSVVQSLITLTCKLIEAGHSEGSRNLVRTFFGQFTKELSRQVEMGIDATDADYIEFQRTVNANVKSGPRIRHRTLMRKLFAYNPEAIALFGPEIVAETASHTRIKELATSTGDLLGKINTAYSANTGDDLFKMTNRTSQAILQLGNPLRNYSDYQNFIDNLYFLFHEGPSSRLEGNRPMSFVDVNVLRTALRHDVDHGEQRKVKSKRRKSGEAFRKFAGHDGPETLPPEQFLLFQANLLAAIEGDLRILLKEMGSPATRMSKIPANS